MLLGFRPINCQITPPHNRDSYSHIRRCRLCLRLVPQRNCAVPPLTASSSTGATVFSSPDEEKDHGFHFSREKETGFIFDAPLELSELKRFESPAVEVKELEDLPDQWRRSRLAWLCKELPAHRAGTFIRVLNAQRKWIRQEDCTYVAVHCMRIRENEAAFRVYKWMMQQHWFQFHFALATKLADYLGKERKYLKCREVYDDIVKQGLVPNESTFHILIVAYLSSPSSSCVEEACHIYNKMIHLGDYKPRLSLHNSLFRALVGRTGVSCKHHLKQAEFIFHNLVTCGLKIHDDIYGGLIWLHSYQDTVDKERIASLRADMKSAGIEESMEVLVSVLRACLKESDVAEAERIWLKILSFNKKPPTLAFLYLMEVHSRVGEPMKSLEIFRDLQEKGLCNVVSYYKIIQILCKAQEADLAESLMTEFKNSSMKPLTESFIDLMYMYTKLGWHDKVEVTFFRCRESCHTNLIVYNLYLDSLVRIGNLDRAEEIFNEMCANEAIGVNAKASNTILRAYLEHGHDMKAEMVYSFMREKKYEVESSLMKKLENISSLSAEKEKTPMSMTLGREQREILIGLLLGGLRIIVDEENKSYSVHFVFRENCSVHFFLKRHIYNQYHEWLSCKLPVDDKIPYRFTTLSHSYFKFYADQFWPQGLPAIPNLIHRWLTPRILAYWYMYGGYRIASGDILLKLKFCKEDVMRIAKAIKARGLNCRIKSKGRVFWMGFLGSDAIAFWKLVQPYILADLKESLEAGIPSPSGNSETKNTNISSGSDTDENLFL